MREGGASGGAFPLDHWQRKFLRAALFGAARRSALSVPRGCGKTTLMAAVGAAFVSERGPLAGGGGKEVVVVAASHGQGGILFRQVRRFLEFETGRCDREYRISDSVNGRSITCLANGNVLRVIGSESRRAHGLMPNLILADEPA